MSAPATRPPRTARMPAFIGGVQDPDGVLAALRLAVFGVGSVGRNIAMHLARLMPRELILVDPGHYKDESLLTQPIAPSDVGQPKATNTGALCRDISPATEVISFQAGLQDVDRAILADCDYVFLSTDNLLAEVEAARVATALGRPLIQASVHGDSLTAQVRVFTNRDREGSCLLCAFGRDEWRHLDMQTRFRCTPAEPLGTEAHVVGPATFSVSPLCAIAADMAVLQMLRMSLGLGGAVADSLVEYNAYGSRTVVSGLSRNPDCPADHVVWHVVEAPRALDECSLAELARTAGVAPERQARAAVTVGASSGTQRYFASALCPCGNPESVSRFAAGDPRPTTCSACGGVATPNRFESYDPVPMEVVRSVAERALAGIVDTAATWVLIRDGDRATMFRDPVVSGR